MTAAESFVAWFYQSVNERRSLTSFYVDGNAKYAAAGNTKAQITINPAPATAAPPTPAAPGTPAVPGMPTPGVPGGLPPKM